MIIGISGKINSGKDTVASMISLILGTQDDVTYADFVQYRDRTVGDSDVHIVHFADGVKQNLSMIFGIPVSLFNSRVHKDEMIFEPITGKFYPKEVLDGPDRKKYVYIGANKFFKKSEGYIRYTTLRYLMEYYAENVKTIFGRRVWAYSIMNLIKDIEKALSYVIVPDVRFVEEMNMLEDMHAIIINVKRPEENKTNNHISNIGFDDIWYDNIIDNNGTEEDLFNKVKSIIKTNYENS